MDVFEPGIAPRAHSNRRLSCPSLSRPAAPPNWHNPHGHPLTPLPEDPGIWRLRRHSVRAWFPGRTGQTKPLHGNILRQPSTGGCHRFSFAWPGRSSQPHFHGSCLRGAVAWLLLRIRQDRRIYNPAVQHFISPPLRVAA
jgi:hypothetical protein